MERRGRHPPKAATVVTRAVLVSEETGSAFHPQECHTLSYTVGIEKGISVAKNGHTSTVEVVLLPFAEIRRMVR